MPLIEARAARPVNWLAVLLPGPSARVTEAACGFATAAPAESTERAWKVVTGLSDAPRSRDRSIEYESVPHASIVAASENLPLIRSDSRLA